MGRRLSALICLLAAALLTLPPLGGGCGGEETIELLPLQEPSGFSVYLPPGEYQAPSLPAQALPSTFSAVRGVQGVALSPEEIKLLLQQGLAATSAEGLSLRRLYLDSQAPPLVTLDLLAHAFLRLCREAELEAARGALYEDLLGLSLALVQRSSELAEDARGRTAEAARANQAFFGVGARLLDPSCSLPPEAEEVVAREVRLVEEAETVEVSPIFGYELDYRLMRPDGALAEDPRAAAFFRAAAWYAAAVMRIRPGEEGALVELGRKETRQAALAVAALHTTRLGGGKALDAWERVWQTCRFFLSMSGGLSVHDYTRAMREVLGERFSLADLEDDGKLDRLRERLLEQRGGRSSFPGPGEESEIRRGLHLLGERRSPDRSIEEALTDPAVAGRRVGCGLDLPGALGSQRALSNIDKLYGGGDYADLGERMEMLRRSLAPRISQLAAGDLSWGLIESTRLMLTEGAEGLPAFMLSPAWQDRCLFALLGAWVSWRGNGVGEDTGSVSGAGAEGSGTADEQPSAAQPAGTTDVLPGYVEPNPPALARLISLADMTERGLRDRGMLDERLGQRFRELGSLLKVMLEGASRELAGVPFGEEEAAAFRDLPEFLESLGADDAKPRLLGMGEDILEGTVLQAATGRPVVYHALVLYQGAWYYVRGGGLSYYELRRPEGAALDSRSWGGLVEEGREPLPPPWTGTFLLAER